MRFGIVVLSFLAFLATQSIAVAQEKVGVIQYNVKGSGNGWIEGSPSIEYKLRLMTDVINTNSVDFITLEEADQYAGIASPLVSDELKARGVAGWKTLSSSCNKDVVQIAYSSSWALLNQLGPSDGRATGFGWKNCAGGDGRPYDIGLFKSRATGRLVLLAATHLPHCYVTVAECAHQWSVATFHEDAIKILSRPTNDVAVIIAGDMNEVGFKSSDDDLALVFTFRNLKKSQNVITCCKVDGWRNYFDHIAATGPTPPTVDVKRAPADAEKYFAEEEHRMIFSEVPVSY